MNTRIWKAIEDIQNGNMCLVYFEGDDEVSLVAAGEKINHDTMTEMKRLTTSDILICVDHDLSLRLGMYYLSDILDFAKERFPNLQKILKKPKPWSLPIDHVNVKTGSSDEDKILTIRKLAEVITNKEYPRFLEEFNAPGHIRVFIGHPRLMEGRKGHTELSLALMKMSQMKCLSVISSMKDLVSDDRVTIEQARKYAENHDLAFLEGDEIIEAFKELDH